MPLGLANDTESFGAKDCSATVGVPADKLFLRMISAHALKSQKLMELL
jgi:hypothetical protein